MSKHLHTSIWPPCAIMRQTLTSQSQMFFFFQNRLIILSGPLIALKGLKAAQGRTVRKMPALLWSLDGMQQTGQEEGRYTCREKVTNAL